MGCSHFRRSMESLCRTKRLIVPNVEGRESKVITGSHNLPAQNVTPQSVLLKGKECMAAVVAGQR